MPTLAESGKEILRVLCGSRAYGLDTPESDHDYHAVFVMPTERLLGIGEKISETAFILGDEDHTAWELKHFLELAIHCNPTVIETFVAPVADGTTDDGIMLRALFPHVLARKRIYDSFRGYAKNQRTKMFDPPLMVSFGDGNAAASDENRDKRSRKAAVAYLRSLWHGIELLRDGTYNPYIKPAAFREELLAIKQGKVAISDVIEIATRLEVRITDAFESSSIPMEPNLKEVNNFLLAMRREYWSA